MATPKKPGPAAEKPKVRELSIKEAIEWLRNDKTPDGRKRANRVIAAIRDPNDLSSYINIVLHE